MIPREEVIILTRKELYESVWMEPIVKLAKEWGMSDVGLAKACRRHDIPIPPRGYWAKKEFGKPLPKRPVLPKGRPEDEEVRFSPWTAKIHESVNQNTIDTHLSSISNLIVPAELNDPHPLVVKTAKLLRNTKKADPFLLPRKNSQILSVEVTPDTLERGLRIMDTVVKALEECDLQVQIHPESKITYVTIENETIEFGLREKLENTSHEPTKHELAKKEEHWWYDIPKYDVNPSGRLSLSVVNANYLGVRQNWADGKVQRLEDCLEKFLIGLFQVAEAKKRRREERAAREREWEEQRKVYAEQRRLIEIEEKRIGFLKSNIRQWREAEEIRAYLKTVQNNTQDSSDVENVSNWCEWISAYAESIDPLARILPKFDLDDLENETNY
tara:strand:- start:3436 stop:4593 length:1158 start_codon:yes stop_codon:yes gene_type:complete